MVFCSNGFIGYETFTSKKRFDYIPECLIVIKAFPKYRVCEDH